MNKKKFQIWFLRVLPILLVFLKMTVLGSAVGSNAEPAPDWAG